MFLAMILASNPVIDWAIAHLHWPFIVGAAWWLGRKVTEVKDRAIQVEGHVTKMATNCFPTMEKSLIKQESYLANIDTNIGRMADKL